MGEFAVPEFKTAWEKGFILYEKHRFLEEFYSKWKSYDSCIHILFHAQVSHRITQRQLCW